MTDKGTGAENLIWLAGRQSSRANPASLAADDILAALTERIAELEARVSTILAEVEPEAPRVDSARGRDMSAPKADAGSPKPNRDARVEADDELTRASEERRLLASEMRLLREAIQEARRGQPAPGLGANAVEQRVAPDLRAAIADEMRVLLAELFADFRSRAVAPPPPIEGVPAKIEITAHVAAAEPAPVVEDAVADLQTAPPPTDTVAIEAAPIETVESIVEHVDVVEGPASKQIVDTTATDAAPIETTESIVEHVDELIRPTTKHVIENSVEDLQEPEPIAPADVFPVEAPPAQSAAALVEEEFLWTESPPPSEVVVEVVPPEPAPPIVDEHVFGPAEPVAPIIDEYVEELRRPEAPPPTGMVDVGPVIAEPIEPIIDENVDELRPPEAQPIETFELSAAPSDPIIDEYIAEPRWPEAPPPIETTEVSAAPSEPIEPIVDDSVVPASDVTMTPPAPPPAPDPRLAALWEAASLPTEAETAPLSEVEPASFITEQFIAETRSLEIPEAPQEIVPEQTIEFAPPPPVEFAPPPPVEYAPEPPAIVEPEPETYSEPLIEQSQPAPSFSSLFPELTVADERGLHQIQVVISPIHSFPRLLETERRIRALSTVNALHLRDYRNGVATLTVAVSEAISPAEFGAVIQMLESLHLRLEGTTQTSVELRAEDEPPTE